MAGSWIRAFVMSSPGYRPMRPNWGMDLKAIQFDPNQPLVLEQYIHHQLKALERTQPLLIDAVKATVVPMTNNQRVEIRVNYTLTRTQDTDTVTVEVPFGSG